MGRTERSGNVWYVIKNIMLAIGMPVLATLAAGTGAVMLPILGYFLFFSGTDYNSTGSSTIVSLLGFGLMVLGTVIRDPGMLDTFNAVAACIGALFIVYMGLRQTRKKREPYCKNTKYERKAKILTTFLCLTLIFGGILTFIGSVCNLIMEPENDIAVMFIGLGAILCFGGMVLWIAYTVTVMSALKESGSTINSFKRKKGRSQPSRAPAQHIASEYEVSVTMTSVSMEFSGKEDCPYKGTKLTYTPTAFVKDGKIEFTLYCKFSGQYPASIEKTVIDNAQACIKKRQQELFNRAERVMNSLQTDRDYTLTVGISIQD